eukprot:TRINITY_DN51084_c0_g1_i1.p1 TRINITY_DN51084_c0_g1~~TRINITY_DN51084_c0_g1_i1.p1  ORF type:complete len:386 (+),score=120.68 TRINITY_DN51084_c0_g1_i1:78-1160(+)
MAAAAPADAPSAAAAPGPAPAEAGAEQSTAAAGAGAAAADSGSGRKRKRAAASAAPAAAGPAEDPEATARRIKAFIDGLRFTRPLWCLEDAAVRERAPCPQCGKRRQYYCYDCVKATHPAALPRPSVDLPLRVHVVLHPAEHRGKATSVQAGVLSRDVSLSTHPAVPEGLDPETTLLAYPSPHARTIDQLREDGTLAKVTAVVFIDSTWQQSKGIGRDPRLARLTPVQLNEYRTIFWRFQNTGDDRFLATVEAIYYFVRDFAVARGATYCGEFDDLLYYYVHQYCTIQRRYRAEGRAFTKRHQKADQYIQSAVDFSYLLDPPGGAAAAGSAATSGEDAAAAAPAATPPPAPAAAAAGDGS